MLSTYALDTQVLKKDLCTSCGACAKICKMQVDPHKTPNSAECIRCGECVKACPAKSLSMNFKEKKKDKNAPVAQE